MSDTAQGPGWWQTADGRWYAPESHPEYSPSGRLGTHGATATQPAPATTVPAAATTTVPNAAVSDQPTVTNGPPVEPPALPPNEHTAAWPAGPSVETTSTREPLTPLRLAALGGLGLATVGVFMAWASATASLLGMRLTLNVAGTHLQTGRIFLGVLVVIIVCSWWHWTTSGRMGGAALSAAWLAALAVAIYEMSDVTSVPTHDYVTLDIGLGLYLCGLGALLGTVCSVADLALHWSPAPPGTDAGPVLAFCGVAVLAAMVLAVGFGSQSTSNPLSNIPSYKPSHFGGSGTSGGTGTSGSGGGVGSSGDTGNTGSEGGSGSSGTTGSTGNTGLGNSGFSNSGAGNSGFGNSGVGDSGFGNSGTGNSGLGNSGTGNSGFGNSGNSGAGSI
jgi:hypothetical protein